MKNHYRDLENKLRDMLNNAPTKPKYHMWQQTAHGEIVGFYWRPVGYAYQNGGEPGWHYHVLNDFEMETYPEEGIEPLESQEAA